MRLTLARAALLVVLMQWLLEWLGWNHPPASASDRWVIVVARGAAYAALSAVAVLRGRRWTAPLVPLGAVLAASLGVCVVGILTGQFLARGVGPASVLAALVYASVFALAAGAAGAIAATLWVGRRARRARHSPNVRCTCRSGRHQVVRPSTVYRDESRPRVRPSALRAIADERRLTLCVRR
jgi:hypothetical protein